MSVLICGSRDWTDESSIRTAFVELRDIGERPHQFILVGDCRGADQIASKVAPEFGFEVEHYPAKWDQHGKAAGPIRNQRMIAQNPEIVLAFTCKTSGGTWDTIRRAVVAGIPVRIYSV